MAWFRLDDQGAFHEKVIEAGNEAYGAWCRAGQWSSSRRLEGAIPRAMALTIAPLKVWLKLIDAKGTSDIGLIEAAGENFQIHDFLDWNPTAEEVTAKREVRAEAGRIGGRRSGEVRRAKQTTKQTTKQLLQPVEANDEAKTNPVPVPVPVPEEIKISERAPDLPPGGLTLPAGLHGQPVQVPRPGFVASSGSGSTTMPEPPPADIVLDDDILGYCGMAGTPVPTRDHVLKFLANARSKGYAFTNWTERFKLWMLNEKKRASRERDQPGLAAGRPVERTPAIHKVFDPASFDLTEEQTRRGRPREAPPLSYPKAPTIPPKTVLGPPGKPVEALSDPPGCSLVATSPNGVVRP